MKTKLLNVVGCLALSMGLVIAGVEPAFSQQDEASKWSWTRRLIARHFHPLGLTTLKLSSATGLRAKIGWKVGILQKIG